MTALLPPPRRLHRSRRPGARMPKGPRRVRYVGRGSRYGNPFAIRPLPADVFGPDHWTVIDMDGRVEALRREPQIFTDKYDARVFATRTYELHTGVGGAYPLDPDEVRADLGGCDIACWCPLPEPGHVDYCHGRVLLHLANPGLKPLELF